MSTDLLSFWLWIFFFQHRRADVLLFLSLFFPFFSSPRKLAASHEPLRIGAFGLLLEVLLLCIPPFSPPSLFFFAAAQALPPFFGSSKGA